MTVSDVVRWLMKNKCLGVREATRVCMAIVQWAIASEAIGHFASVRTAREWSGESKATWDRRSSLIRRHLSEHEFHYVVGELQAGSRHRFKVPAAARARRLGTAS